MFSLSFSAMPWKAVVYWGLAVNNQIINMGNQWIFNASMDSKQLKY